MPTDEKIASGRPNFWSRLFRWLVPAISVPEGKVTKEQAIEVTRQVYADFGQDAGLVEASESILTAESAQRIIKEYEKDFKVRAPNAKGILKVFPALYEVKETIPTISVDTNMGIRQVRFVVVNAIDGKPLYLSISG